MPSCWQRVLFLASILHLPETASAGWQAEITGAGNGAVAVKADGDDDFVAAGYLEDGGDPKRDFAVVKLAGPNGAELWRHVVVSQDGRANDLAIDTGQNVVAVGILDSSINLVGQYSKLVVMKLAADTGTELWRHEIPASAFFGSSEAHAVTIDAGGSVIAAGRTQNDPDEYYVTELTILKLDGTSGTEIWRSDLTGGGYDGGNLARSMALDGNGDVFAAGTTDNLWSKDDFTIIKVSGADGSETWRVVIDGTGVDSEPSGHGLGDTDGALSIAVDADGNVIAVGAIAHAATGRDLFAIKLSGVDGNPMWQTELSGAVPPGTDCTPPVIPPAALVCSDLATRVVLDAGGNAYVVGSIRSVAGTDPDGIVLKLAAADGAVLWQQTITGSGGGSDGLSSVGLDGGGNVVVTGNINNSGTGSDFVVAELSSTDGSELWRHVVDAGGSDSESAAALALDSGQDVAVAGLLGSFSSSTSFTVLKLNGDGTPDPTRTPTATATPTATPTPIVVAAAGAKLLVKDRTGAPEYRKLVLLSKDSGVSAPGPGSAADPTANGAEIEVQNPNSGETMTITLPGSGWSGRGNPAGSGGYQYSDPSLALGPCKKVSIKSGKIKASCAGGGLTLTLDESAQGALRVRFALGGQGGDAYCMSFGGVVVDRGTQSGGSGVFKAKNAAPPGSCS